MTQLMVPRRSVSAIVAVLAGCTLAAIAARQRLIPPALPAPRQWLTVPEASRYAGLSEGLLRGLIRAGKLPVLDQPPKVRRADVERLATSGKVFEDFRRAMKTRRARG